MPAGNGKPDLAGRPERFAATRRLCINKFGHNHKELQPMIRVAPVLFLALALLFACGASQPGTLAGRVTVGPLSPVAQAGVPEPTPGPVVFAERKVVILNETGEREVATVDIGPDGAYSVALQPGAYTIDINHLGVDIAKGLPALVEIRAGETTTLDIDIDTGIR
jgi:hypothetical protein